MAFSDMSLLIAGALALATVIGIVVTLPSLSAVTYRLKLILNTLGLAIVVAGIAAAATMLVWGLLAFSRELIYLSFIPFVAAGLTYRFITQRHQTWYGLLGFDDRRERWRSFWDETRQLWGYGPSPRTPRQRSAGSGVGPVPGAGPAPGGTRSFTFSFNLGGAGAGVLGPLAELAAHRLASDRVSVFPNALELSIGLGGAGPMERAHLASYRQLLTVRRDDGAALRLAVSSDLRFLGLEIDAQDPDGSYPISVSLRPESLDVGSYNGAIMIETDDPLQPRLIVPVTATIG